MRIAAVRRPAGILVATSGALLLGALWFQFVAGLPPCEMCFWQRYVHLGVIGLAGLSLLTGNRLLLWLAILAMLGSAGLGLFHAGVEQKWWAGPSGCSGALPTGLSAGELLGEMLGRPLVRCDAIPWSFLGLSMAGWNAIISLAAALAAMLAARRAMQGSPA